MLKIRSVNTMLILVASIGCCKVTLDNNNISFTERFTSIQLVEHEIMKFHKNGMPVKNPVWIALGTSNSDSGGMYSVDLLDTSSGFKWYYLEKEPGVKRAVGAKFLEDTIKPNTWYEVSFIPSQHRYFIITNSDKSIERVIDITPP